MTTQLFTVIVGNRFDPRSEWFKSPDNGGIDLVRRIATNLGHRIATFSFIQSNGCVLLGRSNNRVAFPMTDLGTSLNRFRSNSNGASIRDLTVSITACGIGAFLLLAAQGVP